MGKRLTIIVGAGASSDLIAAPITYVDDYWKPPITSQLFRAPCSVEVLDEYPLARALAGTIDMRTRRAALRRDDRTGSLENVLRDLQKSTLKHTRRLYRQVPLYLSDLFAQISEKYAREPAAIRT